MSEIGRWHPYPEGTIFDRNNDAIKEARWRDEQDKISSRPEISPSEAELPEEVIDDATGEELQIDTPKEAGELWEIAKPRTQEQEIKEE